MSPLFVIFLTVFIDMVGFGIVIPVLPLYAEHFHASPVEIGWLTGIYSGMQIIFVPILGNVCRKRLIDNATWRIRDIGFVSCRTALNPRVQESGWSGSRVDIIRHGFNRR